MISNRDWQALSLEERATWLTNERARLAAARGRAHQSAIEMAALNDRDRAHADEIGDSDLAAYHASQAVLWRRQADALGPPRVGSHFYAYDGVVEVTRIMADHAYLVYESGLGSRWVPLETVASWRRYEPRTVVCPLCKGGSIDPCGTCHGTGRAAIERLSFAHVRHLESGETTLFVDYQANQKEEDY